MLSFLSPRALKIELILVDIEHVTISLIVTPSFLLKSFSYGIFKRPVHEQFISPVSLDSLFFVIILSFGAIINKVLKMTIGKINGKLNLVNTLWKMVASFPLIKYDLSYSWLKAIAIHMMLTPSQNEW